MKKNVRRGAQPLDIRITPTDIPILFGVEIRDRGLLLWKGETWDKDAETLRRDIEAHPDLYLRWS